MSAPADGALLHVVAWRMAGATEAERAAQAAQVVQAFEAGRDRIPGLLRLEVGANAVAAPDAWDVAVCMLFATRADLDAYRDHPDHLAIKARVGPLRSARMQVDFVVPAADPRGPR
jgi:hypothetical protein